jgi:gas vesicle protein
MLEFIIAVLLGGIVGGIGIAFFSWKKTVKLEKENEILKAKINDLDFHKNYVAHSVVNGQKQHRTLNK